MTTPVAAVAVVVVGRGEHEQSGQAIDPLFAEDDLSTQLVNLVVTSDSAQSSRSESEPDETG